MSYASLEEAMVFGWEFERTYVCRHHSDHIASASVNAVTGWFFCYACGHKGRIDPTKIQITVEGVKNFLSRLEDHWDTDHDRYSESWLNLFDVSGPGDYWLDRFDAATCAFYRLGHAPEIGTIPMRDNSGRVLGVITRDLTGARKQKYLYPSRVTVSEYLFDSHQVNSDTVVLTEGATDAMAVYEAGFHCALGCYRAGLSRAQARLLRRYGPRKVYVAFDQDEAGEEGWGRVRALLGRDFRLQRMWWTDYKDLASIPLSDRSEMLHEVLGNDPVARVDQDAKRS